MSDFPDYSGTSGFQRDGYGRKRCPICGVGKLVTSYLGHPNEYSCGHLGLETNLRVSIDPAGMGFMSEVVERMRGLMENIAGDQPDPGEWARVNREAQAFESAQVKDWEEAEAERLADVEARFKRAEAEAEAIKRLREDEAERRAVNRINSDEQTYHASMSFWSTDSSSGIPVSQGRAIADIEITGSPEFIGAILAEAGLFIQDQNAGAEVEEEQLDAEA
jgi:hypothetical protein